jgi:hypothetical protein
VITHGWALIFLGAALLVCVFLLTISLRFNWRFAKTILAVEDAIEESLDVLDTRFSTLGKLAEKDVFFDSPEIRQAVGEIQGARDAVLFVANTLASIDSTAVEDSDVDAGKED